MGWGGVGWGGVGWGGVGCMCFKSFERENHTSTMRRLEEDFTHEQ